jgi:HEAT repeat protein
MDGLSAAETAVDDAVGHALLRARALWERLWARDDAAGDDGERPADVRDLVSTIARGDDTTPRLDLAMQLARTGNREALVPLVHLIEADATLRSSFELRVEMASAFGASLLDVMTLDYIRTSPSGPMRTWAIELLGDVGTAEAVDRLVAVIETMESDDEAIEAAEFALERVPNFAARLVDALTHPKTHVVASAARVLRFRREATALEPLLALTTTLLDPFPALDLARDLGPVVAPILRAYWDGNPAAEIEWRVEDLLRGWGVPLDDGAANRPTET